jgi:hypothetical protein
VLWWVLSCTASTCIPIPLIPIFPFPSARCIQLRLFLPPTRAAGSAGTRKHQIERNIAECARCLAQRGPSTHTVCTNLSTGASVELATSPSTRWKHEKKLDIVEGFLGPFCGLHQALLLGSFTRGCTCYPPCWSRYFYAIICILWTMASHERPFAQSLQCEPQPARLTSLTRWQVPWQVLPQCLPKSGWIQQFYSLVTMVALWSAVFGEKWRRRFNRLLRVCLTTVLWCVPPGDEVVSFAPAISETIRLYTMYPCGSGEPVAVNRSVFCSSSSSRFILEASVPNFAASGPPIAAVFPVNDVNPISSLNELTDIR